MTNHKLGRWLLVGIAIVALAAVAPAVSAHGDGPTADDAPDDAADDWATQMADHMGPAGVEWMETHMGVTVDEAAQGHAAHGTYGTSHAATGHTDGTHGQPPVATGHTDGTIGQGHC